MIFNSIDFAIFLPLVFLCYWFITPQNLKRQNLLILVVSYLFYGWWNWKFLSLIFFSTVIDYSIGRLLKHEERLFQRKLLLSVSIIVNLGFLGFFKYYNFFLDNFIAAFSFFGQEITSNSLTIILPVGISFYTFQTLSYTIDAYRRKLDPTDDFIAFSAFVSFFPQLVAGPIERATHLLPQFSTKRIFEYSIAVDGMRQILWGLFKKVVIADNCAIYANNIFNNYLDYSGSTLVLGSVFFAFQIYGDFSGYSDIAIGTSRLFGFNLTKNFNFPYFSRDIAEFWRRWHISLSTWFRDYLYIPLGGSKGSTLKKVRNTFIIFLVSGFWHGANWTFIMWGLINALYFLPLLLLNKNRKNTNTVAEGKQLPSLYEFFQMLSTFIITCVAWVFFRAENAPRAFVYIKRFFTPDLISIPKVFPVYFLCVLCIFILIEWLNREKEHPLQIALPLQEAPYLRWSIYIILVLSIMFLGGSQQEFIYFQF